MNWKHAKSQTTKSRSTSRTSAITGQTPNTTLEKLWFNVYTNALLLGKSDEVAEYLADLATLGVDEGAN